MGRVARDKVKRIDKEPRQPLPGSPGGSTKEGGQIPPPPHLLAGAFMPSVLGNLFRFFESGAPGGTRTPDLELRRIYEGERCISRVY
jgi:hypothetical protein